MAIGLNFPACPKVLALNTRHPLYRDLIFAFQPRAASGNGCLDYSRYKNHATAVGTISPIRGPGFEGVSMDGVGTDDYFNIGNSNTLKPSLPVTIAVFAAPVATNNNASMISLNAYGGGTMHGIHFNTIATNAIRIWYADGTGNIFANDTRSMASSNGTISVGANAWQVFIGRIGSSTDMQLLCNGVDISTTVSGGGGALAYNTNISQIGGQVLNVGGMNYSIGSIYVWNRNLDYSQMMQITADPFLLFRPSKVWYISTSFISGTSHEASGSGTISISGAGIATLTAMPSPAPPTFSIPTLDNDKAFLRAQEALHIEGYTHRVILYKYYGKWITYNVNNQSARLPGNASQLLATGNQFICTTEDFEQEYTLTSVDWDTSLGYTTVGFTPAFVANTTGGYIAKKYDITKYVLDKGIQEISYRIEGDTLNAFDAGSLNVQVHNERNVFWDTKQNSGILFRTTVAASIAGRLDLGSGSILYWPYIATPLITDSLIGYTCEVVSGVDEGKSYPVIANDVNTFTIWSSALPGFTVADDFVINVENSTSLKLSLGFRGLV